MKLEPLVRHVSSEPAFSDIATAARIGKLEGT